MIKYPIKLRPAFKDYIWGGTKLKTDFKMQSDLLRLAEAWVLSCHEDGQSIIENGELKGKTLLEVLEKNANWLGDNCGKFDDFPVLIKLIDARDNLSVQVHPNDEYAIKVEGGYGKTEMWYVVDCDEDAYLYYGFKDMLSKDELKSRIENNTLLEVLNKVAVERGDCFFIEAGTIHAIGKGILIAEIQQNSNTTYRVYDYGRVGINGSPRQLHVDKAIDVTTLDKAAYPVINKKESGNLCSCKYFTADLLRLNGNSKILADNRSFISILSVSGSGKIGKDDFKAGDSWFIPAGYGELKLCGDANLILTRV